MTVPLGAAGRRRRDAVLAGGLHNPGAVVGILAACEARAQEWRTLRSPRTPLAGAPRVPPALSS